MTTAIETLNTEAISQSVVSILGPEEQIVTAFVAGSLACGQASSRSDIDIFVCTANPSADERRAQFEAYYYALHSATNRTPDSMYPGETPHFAELQAALDATETARPAITLEDPKLYDGIVWAGMLAGQKLCLTKTTTSGLALIEYSTAIVERWTDSLAADIGRWRHLPKDKILKKVVQFNG